MEIQTQTVTQSNELGNIQSSLDYFATFSLPKDARILDVGCNFGSLVCNLEKMGYSNCIGVDVNEGAIRKGKEVYPHIADRLQVQKPGELAFEDGSFDVVLMFDVIEHVPEIKEFLGKHVRRVLKEGGVFIFQTPNKWTNVPWEVIQSRSLTAWRGYHCSLQTLASLNGLLSASGFREIRIEKNNILTDHNKQKIKLKLGFFGLWMLEVLQRMPLTLYPNFWGSVKK